MGKSIAIRLSRTRPWRWIRDLADDLERRGHVVTFEWADGGAGVARPLSLLFSLEKLLFGRAATRQIDLLPPSTWEGPAASDPVDIRLDFTGLTASPSGNVRTLSAVYDGTSTEDALFSALLDQRAPHLAFVDSITGSVVAEAIVSIDDFSVMTRSTEQAFCRLRSLCLSAVSGGPSHPLDDRSRSTAVGRSAIAFAAAQFIGKLTQRLTMLAGRPHHWRIAYRTAAASDRIWDAHRLPDAPWTIVADDGSRYFADPFPFAKDCRLHLFCEEYPYATMRGIISVMEMTADGRVGPAVPIIETAYHLSYPFIFERDGVIWMVPETSENGTIELWRCREYPRAWERHSVLVDGVSATDATIHFGADRLYMFASVKHVSSASHDALMIWSSPKLEGPWEAFSTDPVLFDARASRPAGRMHLRDGVLWRPAQDCSRSYGGSLTLCRVDVLNAETSTFQQSTVARIDPPADRSWTGLHTLNETQGVEVIDLCGRSRL